MTQKQIKKAKIYLSKPDAKLKRYKNLLNRYNLEYINSSEEDHKKVLKYGINKIFLIDIYVANGYVKMAKNFYYDIRKNLIFENVDFTLISERLECILRAAERIDKSLNKLRLYVIKQEKKIIDEKMKIQIEAINKILKP